MKYLKKFDRFNIFKKIKKVKIEYNIGDYVLIDNQKLDLNFDSLDSK